MRWQTVTNRRRVLALSAGILIASGAPAIAAPPAPGSYRETPMFAKRVEDGKLPPVAARLPEIPLVTDFTGTYKKIGRPGGEIRILMARSKDTRIMTVYGYARLVVYNEKYDIVPDILEKVEVEDGRSFTLRLRKGHRWSDGKPFTSDDFRYWWEDVANNKTLTPFGLPQALLVNGARPVVEFPDKYTVRYTWPERNPYFLPALASAYPTYIYMPRHYLKRYHVKYAKAKHLKKWAKKSATEWARRHRKKARQFRFENPALPVLQPWLNTTAAPSQRFVFVRNPYFHRADTAGQQLPYIDRIIMIIADSKIIPAKTGAGESDLQARYLRFDDFTFLKRGQKQHGYKVFQWRTATGAHIALYPNLNNASPIWRKLFRDVRFRRALSLGIDRHEINEVMYYGLASEGANTVLPRSPLFKQVFRRAWAYFDPKEANRLLDEIGLTKRDSDGFRLLPNGERLEIIVEAAAEGTEYTDVMRLVQDSWKKIGVKLFPKTTRREVFRRRVYAGMTQIAMWTGLDYANLRASMPPDEFVPHSEIQLQWPQWGLYYESKGQRGKPPALPKVKELVKLAGAWRAASTPEAQRKVWEEILTIHADQVYTIGIVGGVLQPVVTSKYLRNVPVNGVYAYNPGAHFGLYRMDTFWLDRPGPPKPGGPPKPHPANERRK